MADPAKPGTGDAQHEEPTQPVTDEDGRPIQPQDAPRRDDQQDPSITGTVEEVVPPVTPI